MHRIIIIILLLLSADLFAQNEKIILSGIIKNDSLPIGNVQVINLSTRRGSLSNSKGEFRITARLNDTLAFSDIQYKYKQIRVNKEQIRSKFLTVKLELNVNKLDEVVIFKIKNLPIRWDYPTLARNLSIRSKERSIITVRKAWERSYCKPYCSKKAGSMICTM